MQEGKKAVNRVPSGRAPRNDSNSYTFLLKMSRRLGRVATKSFGEVKGFLNKEITVSPSERFLAGMPRIHLQKGESGGITTSGARHQDERKAGLGAQIPEKGVDLQAIIKQSHEILASANTVFPITIFPDTVFVDRTKVTIIRRDFFWSSDTLSIRIEDVLNVSATVGPMFGSLTIASRVMSTIDHFQINHLWRNDAIHLMRVIQGYVIAMHNKIDVTDLSKDQLVSTLVQLGHDSNS